MAKRRNLLIPPLQYAVDFVEDFLLNFLLPLLVILLAALLATALFLRLQRAIFGRYATPKELLDEALALLKKNGTVGCGVVATNETIHAKRSCIKTSATNKLAQILLTGTPPSDSRERALDNLRMVIQLDPDMIQAYEILAKELLYGEINDVSKIENKNRPEKSSIQYPTTNSSLRHRRGLIQQLDISPSPNLAECRDTIKKGLLINPMNQSLLKLESELHLVMKYGRSNAQTRMMNVGSFGWETN
ncbi:hypothetical protein ACHAW6_010736 [Cyclotella cf. meneghiniana]